MNQELLQAISDLMDQKLEPISSRLDSMDVRFDGIDRRLDKVDQRLDILEYKQDRTDKMLDDLQMDIKLLERDLKKGIHKLQDGMDTIIELLKIHKIVPV